MNNKNNRLPSLSIFFTDINIQQQFSTFAFDSNTFLKPLKQKQSIPVVNTTSWKYPKYVHSSSNNAPNSPPQSSNTPISNTSDHLIKSTNFSTSSNNTHDHYPIQRHPPPSSSSSSNEIRHKSEIEIEVKHNNEEQQRKAQSKTSPPPSYSGANSLSRSNKQQQLQSSSYHEEQQQQQQQTSQQIPQYQLQQPKTQQRRWPESNGHGTTTIHTQTHNTSTHNDFIELHAQLKSVKDENLSKNEELQAILHELTDCQSTIKNYEQQLSNVRKERDQLRLSLHERQTELRNSKEKNEQLQQMIRNEQEHNDEKKLLSLLQEATEERDELLRQQRQSQERLLKFEEQSKHYENENAKMRDLSICYKIKLEKKLDELERLNSDLNEFKKSYEKFEQDNGKLKIQLDNERKKIEELTQMKSTNENELQCLVQKQRTQRYEHETKIAQLDDTLVRQQKQFYQAQQQQRLLEEKYLNEQEELKKHINELEMKIEEVIKEKALSQIRCGELVDENRKLEKALIDKEDDYEEKIAAYKEKNSSLSTQIEDVEKKLADIKRQLELTLIEKDEFQKDMLIAVRVASEMRHGKHFFIIENTLYDCGLFFVYIDAEDRLTKANEDLKRMTEYIEHERAVNKEVQRRQMNLPSQNRISNGLPDFGPLRIKEMIRTLEANSRNGSTIVSATSSPLNNNNNNNNVFEQIIRQRPLSQPCTRSETTNAVLTNGHGQHRQQLGTTTDDVKMLSARNNNADQQTTSSLLNSSTTNCPNSSLRSVMSLRSITNEQYDEMKCIVEAVYTRMPGSVCKRDAFLKWCVEKLATYGITITNFSNSWTDGLAFCSLLHSYLPDMINLDEIKNETKRKRFEIAFNIANSVGILSILDIDEMVNTEWPDWEKVMYYVALIFRHFEGLHTTPLALTNTANTSSTTCTATNNTSPLSSLNSSPTFSQSSTSSSNCSLSMRPSVSIPTTLCSSTLAQTV
ncbi:unnamed protein product [Didymodactylos carnosus]|uniref:Calponin-homology (CH) domain-containing protein n=1 Tax=Didymodactylos carnosus TaxID=1234261 RepID=A0A8S2IMG8_9BILA|nr:unnamed protein product [Didymodactylos carnosus]CAF3766097.1 unnamed protein product [Didymodactylos carnosus]